MTGSQYEFDGIVPDYSTKIISSWLQHAPSNTFEFSVTEDRYIGPMEPTSTEATNLVFH